MRFYVKTILIEILIFIIEKTNKKQNKKIINKTAKPIFQYSCCGANAMWCIVGEVEQIELQ